MGLLSEDRKLEIICPRCHHANMVDALKCEWCGAPLISNETKTLDLSEILEREERAQQTAYRPGMLSDGLSLYIAGESRPVVIKGQDQVFLGRQSGAADSGVVDLTAFQAAQLGVSRWHAKISLLEDSCTIEDLGSTNGTWVNEIRISTHKPAPLSNGDQVRLGHLIMFVYYSDEAE